MEIGRIVRRLAELSIGSVAIATLVLAGCGGGSGSTATSTTVTPPVTNTELAGVVTTLAGLAGSWGTVDATGTSARFDSPAYIASDGTNLYVTDAARNNIRKIVIATGAVTTLAGSTTGASGVLDATGTNALFNKPQGIATDGTNLYVADEYNNCIRKIVIATGVVTTLAGSTTAASGVSDAPAGGATATSTARFWWPYGITKISSNLYVADYMNNTIRKIDLNNNAVVTIAGTPGVAGYSNNLAGSAVRFYGPTGITNDGVSLYLTDTLNHDVRKVDPTTGLTTLVAGGRFNSIPASGVTNGTSSSARFNTPFGLSTDGTNIYVGDTNNHTIRKIVLASGLVTTLAGSAGVFGTTDGTATSARFENPRGIVYVNGALYVADWYNGTIRKVQ